MNDASLVTSRKRASDLSRNIEHLTNLYRGTESFAQRLAVDELHRDEVRPIALADLIDVSDVRMIERGRGLSLLCESPHPILIRSQLHRQNLQRDFAFEFRVLRQIHLTHSARADLGVDFVATEFCACADGHLAFLVLPSLQCPLAFSAPSPVEARTRSSSYFAAAPGSRPSRVPRMAPTNPSGILTSPGFSSGKIGGDGIKIAAGVASGASTPMMLGPMIIRGIDGTKP